MLSIGKLSPGQDRYYLEQAHGRVDVVQSVADGVEDYYGEHDDVRGTWLGRGAARLGLSGGVDGGSLRAVLAGLRPSDDAILRAARVKIAGIDLTFSAPKSVSVLFGIGDVDVVAAIRAGHDAAVAEAFAYMDTHAAAVRRGAGGVEVVQADGLIAAAFRHRTSRAGDPQLHTHVLVANLAYGPDGRWSAIDGRPIYAHARAASFVYQAVLRSELTQSLGIEWGPVRKGIAEIAGVPDEVLRVFSRRRAEIEAELAAHRTSGPRASERPR